MITPRSFVLQVKNPDVGTQAPACASCVFAVLHTIHSTSSYTACHRYPPQFDGKGEGFPQVHHDDFCGEWHPK